MQLQQVVTIRSILREEMTNYLSTEHNQVIIIHDRKLKRYS